MSCERGMCNSIPPTLMKQYGQHKAVNNVNLSVKKGEIYGLIGRNGAEKTTVLRLISGLTKSIEWSYVYLNKIVMIRFIP